MRPIRCVHKVVVALSFAMAAAAAAVVVLLVVVFEAVEAVGAVDTASEPSPLPRLRIVRQHAHLPRVDVLVVSHGVGKGHVRQLGQLMQGL